MSSADIWLNSARLAIILLTILLAWLTYRTHLLLKEFEPRFNLLLSPFESLGRLLLVGVCVLLAWLSNLPAEQLGLVSPEPIQTIGLGLAIGLAIQIVISGLTHWAIGQFGRGIYSPTVIRNIIPCRPGEWVLVALAFWPAVAMEELLFRSLWLGGFSQIMPWPALIIGTSILFGLMHQPQGLLGVLTAGSINILFCFLFIWSGELLLPLIAHYTINLLQIAVAYHQKEWLETY